MGFGLNFYGYFVFAALWVCGYFIWASQTNARERQRDAAATQRTKTRRED